jgi:hypothetical protein
MFRRRGSHGGGGGGGGGGIDDDMTIGSATSVSDRIMGRMKRNLSSFGGSSNRNVSSAGSVSSTKSSGRFGRKKKQSYRSGGGDWESVQSAGSRTSLMRSRSTSRFGNSSNNNSSVGVATMEEMDSNESMTLKGISMGRRRAPSAPICRPSDEEVGESRVIDEPVEMSLAELRSMSESELEQSMRKAGVPSEDIARTKDAVMQPGIDAGTADDKRRGSLVALFVNSGHVRLVQTDRRSTLSSMKTNSARSFAKTTATTNIPKPQDCSSASMDASDATLLESKSLSRKSKLDKITELQGEKSSLKRENKALKKTMKKLLLQLSESAKEKQALEQKIESNGTAKRESDAVEDSAKDSLHSVDLDVSVATDTDSRVTRRKESSASQRSQDVSVRDMSILKKKMKKQQQEHESLAFRLKAEIEILTKEVDGLQRELGLALESVDDAEKRVVESREVASKLKSKMRTMTSKLKDLTEEADARDKLIETFTKLLLEKNGIENGEGVVEGKLELAQLIHTGTSIGKKDAWR